jgi:hypothetical protein
MLELMKSSTKSSITELSSVEQDDSRDQRDGGEKISSEFVVARGDRP